jgi:CubicO group peptidase (beta-lactamase class C family)
MYFFLLWLVLVPSVLAQELSTTKPEEVGLSSERLGRIQKIMQEHVDQNHIAGAVVLVARHGKVAYLESFGMRDIEKPMQPDTIFRIASMTKPITSLAVWNGFFSTSFWIDPKEDLIGIFMTQSRPFSPHNILKQFRVLTYQAIAD